MLTHSSLNYATIKSLWIYPVKSLAGIKQAHCELTPQGLSQDRQWMIVDEQGVFVSQRKHPKMAQIKTSLQNDETLTLSLNRLCVSVNPRECIKPCRTQVWQDECAGLEAPTAINHWLNSLLNYKTPLRLVYFDKKRKRQLDRTRFADNTTFYADAAPLLVCSIQSLNTLNDSLKNLNVTALGMSRFRPNIVLNMPKPFIEHTIKAASCDAFCIRFIDHCQRCVMITINPITANPAHAREIFECLSQLNPMPQNAKAPAFGVNCTVKRLTPCANHIISVGQKLKLHY